MRLAYYYLPLGLLGLFAAEHVGRRADIAVLRPSTHLAFAARHLRDAAGALGRWWGRVSTFFATIDLHELHATAIALAAPMGELAYLPVVYIREARAEARLVASVWHMRLGSAAMLAIGVGWWLHPEHFMYLATAAGTVLLLIVGHLASLRWQPEPEPEPPRRRTRR